MVYWREIIIFKTDVLDLIGRLKGRSMKRIIDGHRSRKDNQSCREIGTRNCTFTYRSSSSLSPSRFPPKTPHQTSSSLLHFATLIRQQFLLTCSIKILSFFLFSRSREDAYEVRDVNEWCGNGREKKFIHKTISFFLTFFQLFI